MRGRAVDAQTQQLCVEGLKLWLRLGKCNEFCGADRREVAGMREKDHPFPLVIAEADRPKGGGCGKRRGLVPDI